MPSVTEAQRAHQRLMQSMPRERIRTHLSESRDTRIGWGQKRTTAQKEQLRRDLLELQARGRTRREMAKILGTTARVIQGLLGKGGRHG